VKAIYLIPLAIVAILGVGEVAFAIKAWGDAPPGAIEAQVRKLQADIIPSPAPIPDDNAKCSTCDGFALMNVGQYDRAMAIFRRRAAEGDTVAMNNLGWMYRYGLGVPVDSAESLRWYQKAAALNDGSALAALGDIYQNGLGVGADVPAALKYYEMSAAVGDPSGAVSAGWMYQHGDGAPVDYGKAMRLYRQAAAKGERLAMNQIGFMFQNGLGVKVDLDTAWCFYAWSSANGNERATAHIAELKAAGRIPPNSCDVVNHL
jgi:TPR repeat protein